MQQKHKKTAVILGAILIVLALFGGFFYSQADDTMRELSYESGEIYPYRAEIITKDGNDYYEKTYLFYDGEVPDESITESFRANGARWEYSHTEETPRMKALEKEYVETDSVIPTETGGFEITVNDVLYTAYIKDNQLNISAIIE